MAQASTSNAAPIKAPNFRVAGAPRNKFNEFSLDYANVLNDDYVHGKPLTLKYSGKGARFSYSGKETVEFKGKAGEEKPTVGYETKLITNYNGRNIETKFDSKGLIRLWANWGEFNLGAPLNVSTKLKTNTSFQNASGWVQGDLRRGKIDFSARLHLKNDKTPYFSHRVQFTQGDILTGYVTKFRLTDFAVRRYNFFTSYVHRDLGISLQHINKDLNTFSIGKIVAAALYRAKGNSFVVKATYRGNKKDEPLRFVLGTHYKPANGVDLRAKVNNKGKLSLSTKYKVNDNLSVTGGTVVNLLNLGGYYNASKTIPVPVGFSFDFSFV